MAYAPENRAIYDADSHIMELPDFLKKYADPDVRDDIPEVNYSASLVTDEEVAVIMDQGGRHSQKHVDDQIAQRAQANQKIGRGVDLEHQGVLGVGEVLGSQLASRVV